MVRRVSGGDAVQPLVVVEAHVATGVGVQVEPGDLAIREIVHRLPPERTADAVSASAFRDEEQLDLAARDVVDVDFAFHAQFHLMPLLGLGQGFRAERRPVQFAVDRGEFLLGLREGQWLAGDARQCDAHEAAVEFGDDGAGGRFEVVQHEVPGYLHGHRRAGGRAALTPCAVELPDDVVQIIPTHGPVGHRLRWCHLRGGHCCRCRRRCDCDARHLLRRDVRHDVRHDVTLWVRPDRRALREGALVIGGWRGIGDGGIHDGVVVRNHGSAPLWLLRPARVPAHTCAKGRGIPPGMTAAARSIRSVCRPLGGHLVIVGSFGNAGAQLG